MSSVLAVTAVAAVRGSGSAGAASGPAGAPGLDERRKWVGGVALRRPVAAVAALALIAEAFGIVLLNWVLSIVVDRQQMSLAGLDPDAMSTGATVGGILFGLYLLCTAVILLRAAAKDRAPGSLARIALITCAVVHGVIGAVAVGLVGWLAFAAMMVVLALLVLTLVAYGVPGQPVTGPGDGPGAPSGDGSGGPADARPDQPSPAS